MNEKFLHYIWQHKLHTLHSFKTEYGEAIEVIDAGKQNTDAGPDFFNAKLKIGNTIWAGNVEIHINSSDWNKHKHHTDKAYDSVILHVIKNNDCEVLNSKNIPILQAELNYPEDIEDTYDELLANTLWIPCADKIKKLDAFFVRSWMDALLSERLNNKTDAIYKILDENNNNWEEAFYITIARNFGFGTNSDAFELLAKSLPLSYLGKHKDDIFQIEALLFGQSGLLAIEKEDTDNYQQALQKEYAFLQSKFNLKPMDAKRWKMLRLRPSNFPYIRIAQFASLIQQSSKLFSKIIETTEITKLQKLFICKPSEYWETHYLFSEKSQLKSKKLGANAINIILINTIVPFLFCYGKMKQNEEIQDRAMHLLEEIPYENNSIILNWKNIGIKSSTAYDSQALIELKKKYCDDKKCLQCRIGHKVLTIKK